MAEREKELAVVCSQEQLAKGIFSMWIRTKAAMTAVPGQFLSMYTNEQTASSPNQHLRDRQGEGDDKSRLPSDRGTYRNGGILQDA